MKFVVLDVETANADMASICSIGAASYENGALAAEWYSLINPDDYFSSVNVAIHGIDEAAVSGAPTFMSASPTLAAMLQDAIVVTHTHFDRVAIHQASSRWRVAPPSCRWMDSARVARRTWEDCARRGYGLRDLCKRIGYTFQHHNALEDAKAAGQIMLAAMRDSGLDLDALAVRVAQPIGGASSGKIERDGNPDGALFGEVLVFTGDLDIPRREAPPTSPQHSAVRLLRALRRRPRCSS